MTSARVLIVDDVRNGGELSLLLKSDDVEIALVQQGDEALQKARQWHPDVIFLSTAIADTDSFETCRQLRADPEIADIRVFLVSPDDQLPARLHGFEAGADEFLVLPLHKEEMIARVHGVARLNRMRSLVYQHRILRSFQSALREAHGARLNRNEMNDVFNSAMRTLRLAFHPIVRVGAGNELFAYEALLRNDEPRLAHAGSVIAVATVLGREDEIGRAVRAKVGRMLETYPDNLAIFINITPQDLLDDDLGSDKYVLAPYASRIVLELTEREMLDVVRNLRHRLVSLREKGYRFAVDDLGAGYAGLNSFAAIEPEFVKIDRGLTADVHRDALKQKIVGAIASICRDMDIEVIVEGVETPEERDTLSALGCTLQQGFLFGSPVSDV